MTVSAYRFFCWRRKSTNLPSREKHCDMYSNRPSSTPFFRICWLHVTAFISDKSDPFIRSGFRDFMFSCFNFNFNFNFIFISDLNRLLYQFQSADFDFYLVLSYTHFINQVNTHLLFLLRSNRAELTISNSNPFRKLCRIWIQLPTSEIVSNFFPNSINLIHTHNKISFT